MKTHKELVEIGYRWARRSKPRNAIPCYSSCKLAFKEIKSFVPEEPDVIAFNSWISILIECKATRNDFLSDKNKDFRNFTEMGMGQYRFYLANEGIIKPEELPDNWGLLESRSRGVHIIKDPIEFKKYNLEGERTLLCSIVRRIAHFDMLDLINDSRYKPSVIEWDKDNVIKGE